MTAWFARPNLISGLEGLARTAVFFIILILVLILWEFWRKYRVVIPENQVGVVTDLNRNGAMCFYPSGRYFLSPWSKDMMGLFSIMPTSTSGQCFALTKDGNPIILTWVLEYKLDPFSIDPAYQATMAEILLSTPVKMAEKLTNYCLKKIVEGYTLDTLCQESFLRSMSVKSSRSAAIDLATYGFVVEEVSINSIGFSRNPSWKLGEQRHSSRMGENKISRLADPQSGLLHRSISEPSKDRTEVVQTSTSESDPGSSKINYYDTMAKDIYEHTEIQSDISTGKLVV